MARADRALRSTKFKDGFYVNLGIGLPTMIAGFYSLKAWM